MSSIAPFPIREHAARPHRVAAGDRVRIGVKYDVHNTDGVTIEHVRDGVALTPKGALLLEQFKRSAS